MGLPPSAPRRGRSPAVVKLPRQCQAPLIAVAPALDDCDDGRQAGATVVFIRDPDHAWEIPAHSLAQLFGLTATEARAATVLVRRRTLQETAIEFGVS